MKNQALSNPLRLGSAFAWPALGCGISSLLSPRRAAKTRRTKTSCGGVVINHEGRVLLRQPAGRGKGYYWTFAKGKPEMKESSEAAALREVLEETGIRARIVTKIPGSFNGSNTVNEYFLMVPLEDTRSFDAETAAVRWVTRDEAKLLISLTEKPNRRERDLRVLKAAFRLFYFLKAASV